MGDIICTCVHISGANASYFSGALVVGQQRSFTDLSDQSRACC